MSSLIGAIGTALSSKRLVLAKQMQQENQV